MLGAAVAEEVAEEAVRVNQHLNMQQMKCGVEGGGGGGARAEGQHGQGPLDLDLGVPVPLEWYAVHAVLAVVALTVPEVGLI